MNRLAWVSGTMLLLSMGLGAKWFAEHDVTVRSSGCATAEAIGIGVLFLAGAVVGYVARLQRTG